MTTDDDMKAHLYAWKKYKSLNLPDFAKEIRLSIEDTFATLYTSQPISARVWDAIKTYFEPMRKAYASTAATSPMLDIK